MAATEPWMCPLCERKFKIPLGASRSACPDCQNKPVLKRTAASERKTRQRGQWYIQLASEDDLRGPVTLEEVQSLFRRGTLTTEDFAQEGDDGQLMLVSAFPAICRQNQFPNLLVSTTDTLPLSGVRIEKIFPVVSVRRIYGINFFADLSAAFGDLTGGRVQRLENAARDIEQELLDEIREAAHSTGGNAVLGYRLQLGNLNGGNSYMMYGFAQGTPIVFTQPMSSGDGLKAESYFRD